MELQVVALTVANFFISAQASCRKCVAFKVKALLLYPSAQRPKFIGILMCVFQDMFFRGPNIKTTLCLLIPAWRTMTRASLAV